MKSKISEFLKGISPFLLLFMVVYGYSSLMNETKNDRRDYETELNFLKQENDQLIKDNDIKAHQVYIMSQNQISNEKAIELLEKEVKSFKSIITYTKAELKTEMHDIIAKYVDDIDTNIIVSIDSVDYIKAPARFKYSDQWTNVSGEVGKLGVVFDTLSFINKFDVTIGTKKEHWYSKSKPVVELKSYNPNTSVPYVNNIVVKKNKTNILLSKPAMIAYGVVIGLIVNGR